MTVLTLSLSLPNMYQKVLAALPCNCALLLSRSTCNGDEMGDYLDLCFQSEKSVGFRSLPRIHRSSDSVLSTSGFRYTKHILRAIWGCSRCIRYYGSWNRAYKCLGLGPGPSEPLMCENGLHVVRRTLKIDVHGKPFCGVNVCSMIRWISKDARY